MGTFDDLMDKARVVANTATKMTEEVVEISKTKIHVFKINSSIQKAYEKLGAAVYESVKSGMDSRGIIAAHVAEVDTLMAELDNATQPSPERNTTANACSKCGYTNQASDFFCSRCGNNLDTTQTNSTTTE